MNQVLERVGKLNPFQRLCYWIKERHQIFLRREAGKPKPWTEDPILQSYYFTNPYRENDKVTIWFRNNIREPLQNNPDVLFATIAFRWFNWPDTGNILKHGYNSVSQDNLFLDWDCREAVKRLTLVKNNGQQVFTGAFNISNSGSKKPKINRVCEDYIQPVWKQRNELLRRFFERFAFDKSSPTLQEAHSWLSDMPGLGGSGFMAAQVVCDLKYTHLLVRAHDWATWCSPGPGSKRGLNRVNSLHPDCPLPKDWLFQINNLRNRVNKQLLHQPDLHAQDVQNCLCEFDKWERARLGEGHMKRKYPGV